jgi:hypothetical protein
MKKAAIIGVLGLLVIGTFALIRMIPSGDIVDLLNEGKIDVEMHGGGIQRVYLTIRRLVAYPLIVRIPVGTYFVASNTSSQNMVTTAESKIWLFSQWESVGTSAACANRIRKIPGSSDTFTVQRSAGKYQVDKACRKKVSLPLETDVAL